MAAIKVLTCLLLISIASANLLLGGKTTDQETYPGYSPSTTNDGILNSVYHSHGTLSNNWLDVQTATEVSINTILLLTAD